MIVSYTPRRWTTSAAAAHVAITAVEVPAFWTAASGDHRRTGATVEEAVAELVEALGEFTLTYADDDDRPGSPYPHGYWYALTRDGSHDADGPDPLTALSRLVASIEEEGQ